MMLSFCLVYPSPDGQAAYIERDLQELRQASSGMEPGGMRDIFVQVGVGEPQCMHL